jgi:hypothetical protein
MIISDQPIVIKNPSLADLGLSSRSNQTHIGLPENYIKDWLKPQSFDGYIAIKDYGFKKVTTYINCITRKNGDVDAPKIITKPPIGIKTGVYRSALKEIRKAGQYIKKDLNIDKIVMIVCFNSNNEIVIIISEFENEIFRQLKNHTSLINRNGKIPTKVLEKNKDQNDYKIVHEIAQFYSELIEAGLPYAEYKELVHEGVFEFSDINDARKKILRSVVVRQGQHKFRNQLLQNYKYRCCMTKCNVIDTLEACHIFPYMGPKTNYSNNGIILRSDLHVLFDKNKIAIDNNYKVILSDELKHSDFYKFLDNKKIELPNNKLYWPDKESISYKLKEMKF